MTKLCFQGIKNNGYNEIFGHLKRITKTFLYTTLQLTTPKNVEIVSVKYHLKQLLKKKL